MEMSHTGMVQSVMSSASIGMSKGQSSLIALKPCYPTSLIRLRDQFVGFMTWEILMRGCDSPGGWRR